MAVFNRRDGARGAKVTDSGGLNTAGAGDGVARVMFQATPTEGSLGHELVKPSQIVTTPGSGLSPSMGQLLKGPQKLAVVGATGGTINARSAAALPLGNVRIVTFTGTRATGAAPYASWSETVQAANPDGRTGTANIILYHEVEFLGALSGYVFHNIDDDARVDADEALEGVLVLARAGTATGAVVDSARTDRAGKYSFKLWEGTYFIDPVRETVPARRGGFQIGLGSNTKTYGYTGGGTALTVTSFAAPNTSETDFFVLYNKGIIELDVSAANGRNPYAAGDALVVQATLEACDPPNNVLGGPSTGSTTVAPGTPGVANIGCQNARTPNAQTTNSAGKAVWENLREGYYRISLNATTTKGDAGLTNNRGIIVKVALPTDSPARTRVTLTPTLGPP